MRKQDLDFLRETLPQEILDLGGLSKDVAVEVEDKPVYKPHVDSKVDRVKITQTRLPVASYEDLVDILGAK
jgi:hypothetical protein